jgi:hypothetical protein
VKAIGKGGPSASKGPSANPSPAETPRYADNNLNSSMMSVSASAELNLSDLGLGPSKVLNPNPRN